MTMQTIRKSASKKIKSYLDQSVGIIAQTSTMQIDDSFDTVGQLVTASDVIDWLARPDKYEQAEVVLFVDDGRLCVSGPHYFSDRFDVYLDQSKFDKAVARNPPKPEVKVLPSNVISLCAYRQGLSG